MSAHQAKKRFGQNFLQDEFIIRCIISALEIAPENTVIEIGPGLGALTQPLSGSLKHLHVIEIDRDLIARLKHGALAQKLTIHEGDALNFDFDAIAGPKKIIGNLPYNISTPLLLKLTAAQNIEQMVFMLQKEVVQRLVAAPGGKDYGRLSIVMQYFFEMESIIEVPPHAFNPPPKVMSEVVRLIASPHRLGQADDFEHFSMLVKQAFSQRRKTLRNTLKSLVTEEQLRACGINPADRPEAIAPEIYVRLSNHLVSCT